MAGLVIYMGLDNIILRQRIHRGIWTGGWLVAEGAWPFLDWALHRHQPRWLTEYDMTGGHEGILKAVCRALGTASLEASIESRIRNIPAVRWHGGKSRSVIMDEKFVWLVSAPLLWDIERLNQYKHVDKMIFVRSSSDQRALENVRHIIEDEFDEF